MPTVEREGEGDQHRYTVAGRELSNGDEVLIHLGGNAGWEPVTVAGLPDALRIKCKALDGKELITTLPFEAEVRWPKK